MEYPEQVSEACRENDLDESLLRAVIWCESRYRPRAVSSAGARGLMQLTEDSFLWVRWRLGEEEQTDFDDAFDPQVNLRYGAYLLAWLLETFDGEEATALAAYNAGSGVVRKWLEDPALSADGRTLKEIPYAETAAYVPAVLKAREAYREKLR